MRTDSGSLRSGRRSAKQRYNAKAPRITVKKTVHICIVSFSPSLRLIHGIKHFFKFTAADVRTFYIVGIKTDTFLFHALFYPISRFLNGQISLIITVMNYQPPNQSLIHLIQQIRGASHPRKHLPDGPYTGHHYLISVLPLSCFLHPGPLSLLSELPDKGWFQKLF